MQQRDSSPSQSYFWPTVLAVGLHVIIFGMLFVSFSMTPELPPSKPIVQATLYQLKSQSQATTQTNQKIAGEAKKTAAKQYEAEQMEQRKIEQQKQAAAKAAEQKKAEEARKAEAAKAAADKAAAAKKAEEAKKVEQQKQAEIAKKKAAEELAKKKAAEEAKRKAAEEAKKKAAAEAAKKKAAEEAKKKATAEAARKAAEDKKAQALAELLFQLRQLLLQRQAGAIIHARPPRSAATGWQVAAGRRACPAPGAHRADATPAAVRAADGR